MWQLNAPWHSGPHLETEEKDGGAKTGELRIVCCLDKPIAVK